jgi:hypothetical protein
MPAAGSPADSTPADADPDHFSLFRPNTHTIGLELGFVLIPFGFDDPYSAPIGASLFYELRPASESLPIFIGGIVSYYDFNPLNEYFGDSFMVQVGLYAGYEFLLFRTENTALVLSPYGAYKHYFREHIFWDDSVSTNRPILAAGTKLILYISRRISFGVGLEYNFILDDSPIHTLVHTDRFSVGF